MSIGEIRPGIAIVHNGELYTVVNCEHAKLGRGSAFCRAKLKNLRTGQAVQATLRDSDKIEDAFIEKRSLQYLYHQGEIYHFMDTETYEDLVMSHQQIEDKSMWLKDNLELEGLFYQNELIDLELPPSLEFEIAETEPGFRGNTVKTGTKPAKLSTGLVVQVPLFIEPGDKIRVDTRTQSYISRV
ncbi:MAG: elongation factor P [Candidatus Omnitrophica bacterium]|nr:elongation factor P [Candidatus Omnitrophota bacterium]